jgi:hypothetical protein
MANGFLDFFERTYSASSISTGYHHSVARSFPGIGKPGIEFREECSIQATVCSLVIAEKMHAPTFRGRIKEPFTPKIAKHADDPRNPQPCPARLRRVATILWIVFLTVGLYRNPSIAFADDPVPSPLSVEDRDFFEKQVRPLLVRRCLECHGGTKAAGGFSLQSAKAWQRGGESGPAIIPFSPEESLLVEALEYRSLEMPPPDPELLDFLAARFVQSGYSVKAMHRLILKTAAYQRASASPRVEDPDNRWLAHFSRRRLNAEEIRDSVLFVSGRIDLTPGEAHPFPAEATWSFTQHAPFNAVYETNRRSAFMMVQRQRRHPFLALFDGADPNASTPARQTTTVPTQALYFMNDPFFHEQARAFAERILSTPQEDRIPRAFRILFQRIPSAAEGARLSQFVDNYPGDSSEKWTALARVLLASNEFLYVE